MISHLRRITALIIIFLNFTISISQTNNQYKGLKKRVLIEIAQKLEYKIDSLQRICSKQEIQIGLKRNEINQLNTTNTKLKSEINKLNFELTQNQKTIDSLKEANFSIRSAQETLQPKFTYFLDTLISNRFNYSGVLDFKLQFVGVLEGKYFEQNYRNINIPRNYEDLSAILQFKTYRHFINENGVIDSISNIFNNKNLLSSESLKAAIDSSILNLPCRIINGNILEFNNNGTSYLCKIVEHKNSKSLQITNQEGEKVFLNIIYYHNKKCLLLGKEEIEFLKLNNSLNFSNILQDKFGGYYPIRTPPPPIEMPYVFISKRWSSSKIKLPYKLDINGYNNERLNDDFHELFTTKNGKYILRDGLWYHYFIEKNYQIFIDKHTNHLINPQFWLLTF